MAVFYKGIRRSVFYYRGQQIDIVGGAYGDDLEVPDVPEEPDTPDTPDIPIPPTQVVTITFCLAQESEPYAVVKTGDDGKLPNYPETPTKEGYIFAGWYTSPTNFTTSTRVSLNHVFFEDTTVYAGYIVDSGESGGGDGDSDDEYVFYDGYVDDAGYAYYQPDNHDAIYEETYDADRFFNDFKRDETKFYIELFAFAQIDGDFADTENGRYYFCGGTIDAQVGKVDPEGEDLDGDGISDTLIIIRGEYCHGTDIAVEFGGGNWYNFIEAVNPDMMPGIIVDCLNDHKPYCLQTWDSGYGKLVAIVSDDGEVLVVGGRSGGRFVAVDPNETVYHGTAYEVLPVGDYFNYFLPAQARMMKSIKKE